MKITISDYDSPEDVQRKLQAMKRSKALAKQGTVTDIVPVTQHEENNEDEDASFAEHGLGTYCEDPRGQRFTQTAQSSTSPVVRYRRPNVLSIKHGSRPSEGKISRLHNMQSSLGKYTRAEVLAQPVCRLLTNSRSRC